MFYIGITCSDIRQYIVYVLKINLLMPPTHVQRIFKWGSNIHDQPGNCGMISENCYNSLQPVGSNPEHPQGRACHVLNNYNLFIYLFCIEITQSRNSGSGYQSVIRHSHYIFNNLFDPRIIKLKLPDVMTDILLTT